MKTYSKDLSQVNLANSLLRWWQAMHLSEQDLKEIEPPVRPAPTRYRAELKRCESSEQIMLSEGFRALWLPLINQLDSQNEDQVGIKLNIEAWAVVAGVLADVRANSVNPFAHDLGLINPETDKPVVSELRFQQLQASKSSDELLTRARRLIKQLGSKANPVSVADDILCWFQEQSPSQSQNRPQQADKRLAVRWARSYYEAALPVKKSKATY
ncbi:type I-E CRISPR-associated protein Cse2/CasB [Shewanella sp. Isolate7]|uniref:type I-E CRISPR-associated protein Cse2/CasB n=1 Tax=Shewanella sp. Isolate7 TaxID=2908528 RepID=UPI001EFCBCA3|nr:type I-E CRISPR-associated protein Cse2/CasB [Shewanella sp. Isolate7]